MVSRVALPLFREAQQGEAEAQLAVGKLYLNGDGGLKRDAGTAFYWLHKAAAGGSSEAQRLLGGGSDSAADTGQFPPPANEPPSTNADLALAEWLLSGQIPAAEDADAIDVLRRAAAQGERKAQLRLAVLLQSGAGKPDADAEAIHWLRKAAEGGSRAAAVRLADWYWGRFDPSAGTALEPAGESAEPEFLYRLGILRAAKGKTFQASALLAKAALAEHAQAQLYFGLLHASPLTRKVTGVPHSLKKAASWLGKASHGGCAQASFELHRLFRLRQFSLKNAAVAQKYLETAAGQGHAQAQYLIGLELLRDTVGRDNDIAAAGWLLRAARQGHAEARTVARLLYCRKALVSPGSAAEQSQLIRTMARTRIALATRLELGQTFRLSIAELLLFDPEDADQEHFIVLDVRRHLRRARRRIVAVETAEERTLLDRARRLLNARNPHPTDVRGPLSQRKLDLEQSIRLLGQELEHAGWTE
ncbi:MAG: hypothetical protein A3G81_25165 [Betaproteobacteria bacterium RIFCSPLOWO2_12_FULL_65_14]|nr:MAG: hypothetical protein A3G81_25165 [Betaproteobacteria bacterium RIFCSPLOWO2_12_FULL_65_14]